MATIVGKAYKRPTSAYSKYSFAKICKTPRVETLKGLVTTTPALASVLPGSQAYVTPDEYAENIICGGTVKSIGKIIGILATDSVESANAEYYVQGGPFIMQVKTGQTFSAAGKEVWIKTTDGLAYPADGGGGVYVEVGYTVTDPEGNVTVTDPANLPTGTYVYVVLNQVVS